MFAAVRRSIVLASACSAAASAQLTFVLQDRSVAAAGIVTDPVSTTSDSNTESASGFGEFESTVGASINTIVGTADAFAEQHSIISEDVLAGMMLADTFATSGDVEVFADATATSQFDLLFDLASAQYWRAIIAGSAANSAGATFLISEVGARETNILSWDAADAASLRRTLLLRPARYRLTINISASAALFTGPDAANSRAEAEWSFALIPAPSSLAVLAMVMVLKRRRTT